MSGAEPDFYAYRPLDWRTWVEVAPEMLAPMREAGMQLMRVTLINDEFDQPPYPHGWYLEGWRDHRAIQPPFNYPLTDSPAGTLSLPCSGDPERALDNPPGARSAGEGV